MHALRVMRSLRKVLIENGNQRAHEVDGAALGSRLVVDNRRNDSNERAVRTVESEAVENEVHLAEVFAGNGAAVALIPVKDEAFVQTFLNRVAVRSEERR